jgi:hypothetical protein
MKIKKESPDCRRHMPGGCRGNILGVMDHEPSREKTDPVS